jgi:uncharacterized protein
LSATFNPADYFWLIGLGLGVGLYGTLIGAGGGFVLMPVLLLLYPEMKPENLTAISLAVVFFNAASGTESYAIMKRIDYRSGLMFAAATIPGAIIGALNTAWVPRHLFNGIFAVVLLAGGALLFLRPGLGKRPQERPGKHHHPEAQRHLVAMGGETYDYAFNPLVGIGISFFVGYASSFLGIGGGIIHVPVLIYALDFPVHVATATSHFILAIMSLTGTLVHMGAGDLSGGVNETLALAIGVMLGAPLGAQLSGLIRGTWIVRSLALALALVGIRIGIMFFH